MIKKYKFSNLGENDKIVVKNVFGAFLVKGIAMFVSLFTIPAYISYFNNDETLGLWFTILSLLNWILNFDLGIGNGLRNHLSEAISLNKREDIKRYISSAYFSVGFIIFFLSLAFPFLIRNINLNKVLNIPNTIVSAESLYIAVVIVFIGVMLQFLLKLINSVLYALQKSSINNFLVLCTNLITLLFILIAPSYSNDTNIIIMAIVHAVAVALPLLIVTVILFAGKFKFAIPKVRFFSLEYSKKVLSLGGIFFFIQIMYMIIMSTNEYLISFTLSNDDVVDYQVYYKLFSLGSTVFALMLTPIWSVVTKAKSENNYSWIKKTYKRFMLLATIASACEILLVLLMKPLMKLWIGEAFALKCSYSTGFLFAILGCLMIYNSVFSSIVNGMGILKVQAICFFIGAISKVPLSIVLVDVCGKWDGVVIANIISIAIYCIVQPLVIGKYFETKNKGLSMEEKYEFI